MSSTKILFFGSIGKQRWRPWSLIGWDIFNFPLQPLNRIWRNLTVCKYSTSSTMFMFFGPIGKQTWPLRHLGRLLCNRWTEFDEIDRKQVFNVIYHVCVFVFFSGRSVIKYGLPGLRLAEEFSTFAQQPRTQFNKLWHKASTYCPLKCLIFFRTDTSPVGTRGPRTSFPRGDPGVQDENKSSANPCAS